MLAKAVVLLVGAGDDGPFRLSQALSKAACEVDSSLNGQEALAQRAGRSYDLILAQLSESGPELIRDLRRHWPRTAIVALADSADLRQAIQTIQAGATDYLVGPIEIEQILPYLEKSQEDSLEAELPGRDYPFGRIIGQSPGMQKVFELVEKVADTDATVLTTGESGTGKELVARAIHHLSRRRDHPLVPVNCGAIPEELLESELFGHEKGAFTGAVRTRVGRFELANGGTIFLDEIGEMSPKLQVKLLRVLQDGQFERIGGTKTIFSDIRVIAATNQDLGKAVAEGRFREDLYYRLHVIPLHVPPLRERLGDIPALVQYFLTRFAKTRQTKVKAIDPKVIDRFKSYHWPGNIRELENLIERLVILSDGPKITLKDLPDKFSQPAGLPSYSKVVLPEEGLDLSEHLAELESSYIEQALARSGGNKAQAARLLGLNRTTLVEKLKKMERLEKNSLT